VKLLADEARPGKEYLLSITPQGPSAIPWVMPRSGKIHWKCHSNYRPRPGAQGGGKSVSALWVERWIMPAAPLDRGSRDADRRGFTGWLEVWRFSRT
jgi:hypothetical protein